MGWAEFSDALDARRVPAFLLGWVADLTDPDGFVRSLVETASSGNYLGFSDEETDRLLAEASLETNPVERAKRYRAIESRVLELAPVVPLYHTRGVIALRDRVVGLEPGPLGLSQVDLEKVWLRKGRR